MKKEYWPELSYESGKGTFETLHLWSQIAGKVKLEKLPWINHSWHTTLFVTPYGLTTGDIPDEAKHFQIDFDFLHNKLRVHTSKDESREISLKNLSVAGCYNGLLEFFKELEIRVKINPVPNEIEGAVPFHEDEQHAQYNPKVTKDLHLALLNINSVFTEFRSGFIGKCSPVHLFWGAFDLAVTRFSGRNAPKHPGGVPNLPDRVAIEAYSHEVSSAGFWPGNEMIPSPAFYSYIYPEPDGFKTAAVKPEETYYHKELGEFILPYEAVQKADEPARLLMDFLESTYEAAASLAGWQRENLEKR